MIVPTAVSNTLNLTNTTPGSAPICFAWDFGDGGGSAVGKLVVVPPARYFWPLVVKQP